MASNMTTKEKLLHPVTAVKEMVGKGHGHTGTDTTHTAHTGHTQASSAKNEAGVIARYEQPMTGVTHTTPTTMGNEEQLNNQLGGTPTIGTTAGSGARPVFSETGNEFGNRVGHHGHHTGAGVAGAGATGLAGYEAEKHLGQHGQHTGHHMGQNTAGVGATGLAGYEAEKHLGQHGQHTGHHLGQNTAGVGATGVGAYEAEKHLGHHGQHTGHHTGTGLAGAGVGGVGAYEAEKHLGHHNRHNDAATLAGTPGLPGTTGTTGEVFTPNDPRPHNVGLNVIGMNTPLNTSDVRSYDNPTAQSAPRNTTPSHIDEGRLAATSLPANPVMSAVTGGKIPPSIHKGFEQAGVYDGANRTGAHDTTTGVHDTTRVGHTGARRDVV